MRTQMPVIVQGLDRREFLGVAFAAAATVSAMSLVPVDTASAAPGATASAGDWSVDDQWSGYPRYAEAIVRGRQPPVERPAVDPVDEAFVEF